MQDGSLALAVLLCLLLCGCRSWPDSYPPPEQIPAAALPPPNGAPAFIELQGHDGDAHIVRDVAVGDSDAPWRWTGRRPLLKLRVEGTVGLKFFADYAVPEIGFQHTGPVAITFWVNSWAFKTIHVIKPGRFRFEQPVWDFWLNAGEENTVGADIDKVWTDQQNGRKNGFILHAIGFIRDGG